MDFPPQFHRPIAIAFLVLCLTFIASTSAHAAGFGDYISTPLRTIVTVVQNTFQNIVAFLEPHHTVTVEITPVTLARWRATGKTASAAAFNYVVAVSQTQKPAAPPTRVLADAAPSRSVPSAPTTASYSTA